MAYKNIEDKRKYHREYMRERREWLKAHHLCTECKKQDAYTLAGHSLCYEHSKHKNEEKYDIAFGKPPKKKKEWYIRKDRIANKLCYSCGEPLDGQLNINDTPSKLCSKCYKILNDAGKMGRDMQDYYEQISIVIGGDFRRWRAWYPWAKKDLSKAEKE